MNLAPFLLKCLASRATLGSILRRAAVFQLAAFWWY
jgi:hypothetical protein